MRDLTGEPWTWRANLGHGYTLATARNGAKIVLSACVTGDYHAEIVARNEHGVLEKVTPDHPVARLIAASPTMLEALEETEAALDMVPCMCEHGFVCSRCKGLDIARAAIARATGESA